MDTQTQAAPEPLFGNIPLDHVFESATNPRRRFDPVALQEMADTITAHGVAQPILVRPFPDRSNDFEIVFGARRYRASKLAEAPTIPAIVRDLTDEQVAVMQTIENLQREDVHPIEEAEGYERLMKEFGHNVDQLAEQVGKSRAYIYARLKLLALSSEARQAFYDESKLSASTALLIARIPVAKLQQQACKEILGGFGGEPMSYRRAVQHVRARYMLELDEAPFEISDVKLVKAAGSCTSCIKRTGNLPEVFGDVGNADVCTDPDCFESKCIAHRERILAHARKVGIPIVQAKNLYEAKKSLSNDGGNDLALASDSARMFDRLADEHYAPVSKLLTAEQMPEPEGYAQLANGNVEALYGKSAMQAALEKAGICLTEAAAKENDAQDSNTDDQAHQIEQSAQAKQAELETNFNQALYCEILACAESGFNTAMYRALLKFLVREYCELSIGQLSKAMAERFPTLNLVDEDEFLARLDTASVEECECLLLDNTIGLELDVPVFQLEEVEQSPVRMALLEMAASAKVNIDELRASIFTPAVDVPAEAAPAEKKKSRKKAAPAAAADSSSTAAAEVQS